MTPEPTTEAAMRIALVSESYAPDVNGVANGARRTALALARLGHRPVVIAPAPDAASRHEETDPFPVERVPSTPWPRNPPFRIGLPSPSVDEALERLRPDAAFLTSPYLLGGRAAAAARRLAIPTAALYFTDPAMIAGGGASATAVDKVRRQLKAVHDMADMNLAPTPSARRQLQDTGIDRVELWEQGVDTELFSPRRRSTRLRRLLAPRGELIVGYVGRLAVEKQIDLLADAAGMADLQLVAVGAGPDGDRLRGLLPNTRFPGTRRGESLARWFASFDVFVHPGAYETFGLTVREAQASGCAVVVPDAGGAADVVEDGVTGLRFTAHDPASLRAVIEGLAADRTRVAELGSAARTMTAHDWDAAAKALVAHLHTAIARRRAMP